MDENPSQVTYDEPIKTENDFLVNYSDEKDEKLLNKISSMDFGGNAKSQQDKNIEALFDMNKDKFMNFEEKEMDEKLNFLDEIERDIQNDKVAAPSFGDFGGFEIGNSNPAGQLVDDLDDMEGFNTFTDPTEILLNINLEEIQEQEQTKSTLEPVYIQHEREGVHNK